MASNLESCLLRKYYPHLQQTLLHPAVVAGQLCAKSFIDLKTRDEANAAFGPPSNGANIILTATEAYFLASFDDEERQKEFLEMLELLQEHIPLNKVVDKIRSE